MNNYNKGKQYEYFVKNHLLKSHQNVFLWSEIPMKVFIESGIFENYSQKRKLRKDRLNDTINVIDTGCDILYNNSKEWIIAQCKNYQDSVKLDKLAGFFGILLSSKLFGELYYTSSLSKNVTLYQMPIKYIKLEFNNNVVDNKNTPKKLIPYDYQLDAFIKLRDEKRSVLQLPCGMGKTLTSILWAQQFDLILIFSPLRAFAQQNLDRFMDELMPRYHGLLIDSDGSRDINEIIKQMEYSKMVLSFTYKSVDVANDKKLSKFMYQNYSRIGVIVDEFHNLSRNNVTNSEDDFYNVLNNNRYHYLFLSATPRVYELEETDEDITDIIGNVSYKYELRDAINKGYVSDYDIFVPDIRIQKDKYLDEVYKDINLKDVNKDLDVRSQFLLRGLDEGGFNKCIAYLKDHEEAYNFKKSLENMNKYHAMDLKVEVILSDTSAKERKNLLNDFVEFKGTYIMCSCKILDECIDIVQCDSIFIGNKTSSKIKLIQRICRANRKDKMRPNKKSGIFLWCDEFEDMTQTISSLKEYDIGFVKEKLKIVNYEKENKLGVSLREDDSKEYEYLDKYVVGVRKIKEFDEIYEELKEWIKKYNRLPKLTSNNTSEKKLASWCSRKREIYKKNLLDKNEISQLNLLPCWYWDQDELFYKKIKELEIWINKNKKFPVISSGNNTEKQLGYWISTRKKEYNEGRLSLKRISILNSISGWKWDKFAEYNKIMLNNLIEFVNKFNKIPSRKSKNTLEKKIGTWCSSMRKKYNNKNLDKDFINKLEIIEGWYWDKQDLFNEMYDNVKIWINKNNKIPSTIADDPIEKKYGNWCSNIRQRKDVLPEDKINKMNNISSLWYWNKFTESKKNKC